MDKHCPMMQGPCIEQKCRWYIQLLGKHPQKDAPVAEWGCAVEFIPILLIENAQQTRHMGAAVESARNEARKDAASVAASVVGFTQEIANAMRPTPLTGVVVESTPPRVGFVRRLLGRA